MSKKCWQSRYRANVNVDLMVENVIQIKSGKTVNVSVSVKIIKKNMLEQRLYLESCFM